MKVLLASPRGFCAGVNMAIESLDLALASLEPPIYVYHEIVHNKYVVEHFRDRGVTFVDDLAEVPVGVHAALLGPWRIARDSPPRPRAQPASDRRHLPAGHQGASRGDQLRPARLHDPAHRPRRARRSDRHDGRGARGDPARRIARGRRDPERGRRARSSPISRKPRSASTTPTGSSIGLKERFPHIAAPPKDDICYATQNRQEAVSHAGRRGRCRARARQPEQLEQPTAGRAGSRSAAFGRTLSMGPPICSPNGSRASKPCSSPPAQARRRRSSKSASTGSANASVRQSNHARSARKTCRFRCHAN